MNIAIIPARSGSKRIKNKNLKIFNGKHVIYWSIRAAKKTKLFDKIIVTTDSKKIAKVANKYGAITPFLRKKELSNNAVSTVEVIKDAINNLKLENAKICCIYPCAPLIRYKDIIKSFKQLKTNIDFVFSASTFNADILKAFILINKKKKIKLNNKAKFYRGGKGREMFYDAGQFYWGHKKSWLTKNDIFSSKVDIIEIPRWRSQDINYIIDWKNALKLSELK